MASGAAKILGLLQWCKNQVEGYPGVEVANFTKSFRDGLAFCAIIHRYRPELIDFYALSKENVLENNQLAYTVAERELGIPPLLDAEDMVAVSIPDRLSVITYVSQYHNCFAKKTPLGGPNVVAAEPDKLVNRLSGSQTRKKETPLTPANHDTCAICHKSVYMLERQHHNDQLYHRNCLRSSQVKAIGEKVKSLKRGAHLKRNLAPSSSQPDDDQDPEDGSSSIKRRTPSPVPVRTSQRIQPNSMVGLPVPTPTTNHADRNSTELAGSTEAALPAGSTEPASKLAVTSRLDDRSPTRSESPRPSEKTAARSESPRPSEKTSARSESPKPSEKTSARSESPRPSEKTTARSESPKPSEKTAARSESPRPSEKTAARSESPRPSEKTAARSESPRPSEKTAARSESPKPAKESTNDTKLEHQTPSAYEHQPKAVSGNNAGTEGKGDRQRMISPMADVNTSNINFVKALIQRRMDAEKRIELRSRSRSPPRTTNEKSADADDLHRPSSIRQSGRYSHLGDHHKRRAPPPPPSSVLGPPTAVSSQSPVVPSPQARSSSPSQTPAHPPPVPLGPPPAPAIVLPEPAGKDEEYPEDLNPFADDEEEPGDQETPDKEPIVFRRKKKKAESDVTFEYRGKNPFDDDDEDEDPPRPPPLNTLSTMPSVPISEYRGKNPFDTDSEDDTSSHDLSSLSASSIRQSSRRKKRHAPPPPPKSAKILTVNGEEGTPPESELSPSSTMSGLADLTTSAEGGQENGKRKITAIRTNPFDDHDDNETSTVGRSHLRKILPPSDLQASSEGEDSEAAHSRKGPAPSLPVVSRRCVRTDADEEYVPYSQLIAELEQVNEEQLVLEKRGQQLENELRDAEMKFPIAEDADNEGIDVGAEVDALLVSWLELIENKSQLFRKECDLHYRIRQRELEERHADIEFELRQLLAKQDNLKTAEDRRREDLLLQDLQACVRDRSELIHALDEDQQREMSEVVVPRVLASRKKKKNNDDDKHRTRVLGPKFSNVLCMSGKLKKKSKEDKKEKKEKKKKKEKKEKKV